MTLLYARDGEGRVAEIEHRDRGLSPCGRWYVSVFRLLGRKPVLSLFAAYALAKASWTGRLRMDDAVLARLGFDPSSVRIAA